MAGALSVVEAALGTPGSSIDKSLQNFYDAFSRLAESPVSATVRQDVLLQAGSLADVLQGHGDRGSIPRAGTSTGRCAAPPTRSTAWSEQIRAMNVSIAESPSLESSLHLRDDQAQLVRQLSELVDIHVLDRAEGGVDISIGNGRPLVIGRRSTSWQRRTRRGLYRADCQRDARPSSARCRGTLISEITGGKLGGLLQRARREHRGLPDAARRPGLRGREPGQHDSHRRLRPVGCRRGRSVRVLHAAGRHGWRGPGAHRRSCGRR